MTQREKQAEFEIMTSKLVLNAVNHGRKLICLEWKRDEARQKYLISIGRSKTMKSKHLEGLAKDFAYLEDIMDDGKLNFIADKYKEDGEYWESLGGRWGGRFGDNPDTEKIEGWDCGHFEYKEVA